jgi:hypothetical protein
MMLHGDQLEIIFPKFETSLMGMCTHRIILQRITNSMFSFLPKLPATHSQQRAN